LKSGRIRIVACVLACFGSLPAVIPRAGADEFRTPSVSLLRADWRAALDQIKADVNARPTLVGALTFVERRRLPRFDPRTRPALVQLNAVTAELFPGIRRSPVPVLLPFDTAAYLESRQAADKLPAALSTYQAGFRTVDLFDTGPAGYDAVFSLPPGAMDSLPSRIFARPVEVQITGSLLIYDLADPRGGTGEPVKTLSAQFPDLRRFIREGYVRYAFTRFGIPYVVSIQCLDSTPRAQRLACREAYPVAERFLQALHVAGGMPAPSRRDINSEIAERPPAASLDFSYRPSGDIIASSGVGKQGGHSDFTVYAQMRFPLLAPPAFAHSQSYQGKKTKDQPDEIIGSNTSYPWQDNFCESRSFNVGQCPAGYGHQGQDVRPAPCQQRDDGSSLCDTRQQTVVAVRDGTIIRTPTAQAATLQVNTANEHLRFRYMHMNPAAMDSDGLINGRQVDEGEKIGMVSNYMDRPNGTSHHLHFDVQAFTRDGWVWVNPYVTLIAAYERLIGGRGREIGPEPVSAAVAHAVPEDVLRRSATVPEIGN